MITFTRKQPAINFKFFDFLNRETLVDVTVIADGHVMHAHKVVLASASSYFEDIFALIPDKHPAIVLSDVTQSQLTNLMEYIYCGRVELHESDVTRFKKLMITLKIEAEIESKSPKVIPVTATTTSESDLLDEVVKIKEEGPDVNSVIDINDGEEEEEGGNGYSTDGSNDYELPMSMMSQEFSVSVSPPARKVRKLTLPMRPTPFDLAVSVHKPLRVKLNNVVRSLDAQRFMQMNPTLCPFCRKVSKSNKHRNEHVKYCMSNPDRIISKCPHCDKSFCDPYYVRKHMKTIHGDESGSAVMSRARDNPNTSGI